MAFRLRKGPRKKDRISSTNRIQASAQVLLVADQARAEQRWSEAAEFYERYLGTRPHDAPIWVQLGHALKESGNLDGAENAYRRSMELAPEVADTHLQLGHLYKMKRSYSQAIAAYREVVRIDDTLLDAKRELTNLGIPEIFHCSALGNDRGTISIATRTKVSGWLWDQSNPDRQCSYDLLTDDGEVIANGIASQARGDLKDADVGTGKYGFSCNLETRATLRSATIRLRESGTDVAISEAPLPRYIGAIDSQSANPIATHVTGWIVDCLQPYRRPALILRMAENEISIGRASLFRADIKKVNIGDGFAGFEIDKRIIKGGAISVEILEASTSTIVLAWDRSLGIREE
jgi:tetratricopeptide (TPR) repeat protein